MELTTFINKLNSTPEQVTFDETMATVDANYDFTPTAFKNGETNNEEGQNNGSCKLFAFAQLNQLSVAQTLQCFGDFYRVDVLKDPNGDSHQNIRNFIQYGWDGIKFEGTALSKK